VTIETWAKLREGNGSDVQGIMRHSRTTTTTDAYMHEIPASVQSTINPINHELQGLRATNRKKSASTGAVIEYRRKAAKYLAKPLTRNGTKSLTEGACVLPVAT